MGNIECRCTDGMCKAADEATEGTDPGYQVDGIEVLTLRSLSTSVNSFPMMVIPTEEFMKLEAVPIHEDIKDSLVEWTPGMGNVMFCSQTWLGWKHPDPSGVKFELVKLILSRILSGEIKDITSWWLNDWYYEPLKLRKSELASLSKGYVWFDILSIPQRDRDAQARAIASLQNYITQSKYFFVFAGPWSHADDGSVRDVRAWGKRGWCRFEALCNAMSPDPKPQVIVQSASSIFMYHQNGDYAQGWLNCPPGMGQFTVDSDRNNLGEVIRDLVDTRMSQAFDEGDLHLFRVLKSSQKHLLSGTGAETPQIVGVSEWLKSLNFETLMDDLESGWSPLRFAVVFEGRMDLAQEMLSLKADVEAPAANPDPPYTVEKGQTILHHLCFFRDDPELVDVLIQAQASPALQDAKGFNALTFAMISGKCKTIDYLMKHDSSLAEAVDFSNERPLFLAAMFGCEASVRHFFERYPGVAKSSIEFLDHFGQNLCSAAVIQSGNIEVLKIVIENRADVNLANYAEPHEKFKDFIKGMQAEHDAADPFESQPTLRVAAANTPGRTALSSAALFGNLGAVRVLVGARADIQTVNCYGRPAVSLAAMAGHAEITELLIENGSPVDVKDKFGLAANHYILKCAAASQSMRAANLRISRQQQYTPAISGE